MLTAALQSTMWQARSHSTLWLTKSTISKVSLQNLLQITLSSLATKLTWPKTKGKSMFLMDWAWPRNLVCWRSWRLRLRLGRQVLMMLFISQLSMPLTLLSARIRAFCQIELLMGTRPTLKTLESFWEVNRLRARINCRETSEGLVWKGLLNSIRLNLTKVKSKVSRSTHLQVGAADLTYTMSTNRSHRPQWNITVRRHTHSQ